MRLDDFDFQLPEELIAQHPVAKRDESRLLILHKNTGKIDHRHFYEIIDYLHEGDVLVRNNSKVIPARLYGIKKDTGRVIDYIREYDCETVVVGLPLNLNGTDSVQTEKVRTFKEKLENKLRSMALQDIAVVYQDERFTTKLAEQVLIDGGVRREDRKKFIDKQAAVLILQSYLDSLG